MPNREISPKMPSVAKLSSLPAQLGGCSLSVLSASFFRAAVDDIQPQIALPERNGVWGTVLLND